MSNLPGNRKPKLSKEEKKRLLETRIAEATMAREVKQEGRDLWAQLHEERRQAQGEDDMAKTKESEDWIRKEYEQEEVLAQELENLNREEIAKLKYKQQLLESPEIKDLLQQLRTAYMRKELISQIKLNEHNRKLRNELSRERQEAAALAAKIEQEQKEAKEEECKRREEYRNCLQDQIINRYKERQHQHKELLREKALQDDALRSVLEEDRREFELMLLKKKRTKEEIEAFFHAKAVWEQREREKQVLEEQRISEYLQKKKEQDECLEAEKKRKLEILKKRQETVSNFLIQNKGMAEEEMRVIELLAAEDIERREEERERSERENRRMARESLKDGFAKQIEDRLARLDYEHKMEQEVNRKKMEEYVADQKLDQINAEKHQLMKLEYRIKCQQELAERKARRDAETEDLQHWKKLEEKAVAERRAAIEEERLRLLKEHAVNLVGFLPKGMIRPADMEQLPSEVSEFYRKKEAF